MFKNSPEKTNETPV